MVVDVVEGGDAVDAGEGGREEREEGYVHAHDGLLLWGFVTHGDGWGWTDARTERRWGRRGKMGSRGGGRRFDGGRPGEKVFVVFRKSRRKGTENGLKMATG
jgi:hypothetical protein